MIIDLNNITCKKCSYTFFAKKAETYIQACDCDRVFFNILNYINNKRVVLNIDNVFFTIKIKDNIEIICELEQKYSNSHSNFDLEKISLLTDYVSNIKAPDYLSKFFYLVENKLEKINQNLIFI